MVTMRTATPNPNTHTAPTCYIDSLAECKTLLKQIENRLDDHNREQAVDPQNWGHAGDLGQVVQELAQILALLGERSALDKHGLQY